MSSSGIFETVDGDIEELKEKLPDSKKKSKDLMLIRRCQKLRAFYQTI